MSNQRALLSARLQFLDVEEKSADIARRRAANLLCTIIRLPAEILSEVSLLSIASSPGHIDTHLPSISPWGKPALAICHFWRVLLLETPRIWKQIVLDDSTPTEVIDAWLSRAGRMPLDIHITFEEDEDGDSILHTRALWQRILAHPLQSCYLRFCGVTLIRR